ncbi:MAG: PAS domain-containing protein [Rhodospirillales bacterium]|nr:PAS domain-containing protein [Rhodospirillales bacterium]
MAVLAAALHAGRERLRQAAARGEALAAVLDGDRVARLVVDGGGGEVFRNRVAQRLFGPAADPLADYDGRAADDERGAEELARLRAAAAHGLPHAGEVALLAPSGEREWFALCVQPLAPPARGVLWSAEEVTARRAIEEILRRENEVLTDFLDFLPVGVYSADTEGRFRYVNQRLAEWLGWAPDRLIGRDLREVLGVVPDPEDDRTEMRLKGRNGEVFQAFVSHAVYDDAGETLTRSVVVRDLMPERSLERALKAAERRFRWLFDDAPVGIVLVDPDGTVNACNRAFQAMLGSVGEDLAGRAVADFVAQEDRADAADTLSKVLMGATPGAHLEVRLHGRRDLVASLYVSPSAEDGDVTGLVLHFIDTTEQKNLEIQFAQSQKMQAMGQLAGGVAHDFNNLLTAMIGFCDLLLQRHGAGDPSFADIMQIKQNANRAASLVRQLLAFSRRQALQPRLLDVTDALTDLSNLLRRLLGETIELKMVHGRDLGLVRVDPGQFDQVIINLAVNARDAMPGGGTLTIRTAAVETERPMQQGADVMPPGGYLMIEVGDTGTGISKENLGRIFEPFFSTKEVGAGTGLGLSTVYGIVRQTDGFVFVDSAPGHGATFTIYLPRLDADAGAPKRRPAEPAPAGDLTGAGTVLLVEDEDPVRLFGVRALRNKGYRVLEARSGEGALDVLHKEPAIDVLVTDVVMPGMDGVTLARLVRIERPEIRIVLISGYAEEAAPEELLAEGGIDFLPKPFSLQQLAGKVKEVLGRA